MELRLLRYFVAVAEKLHLGCAAERPGIEQSPLSRAMRDLEQALGVALLDRSQRQTKLTWAGQVLQREPRRVLLTVDQAIEATQSAAQGYQSQLRIAICDSLAQPRIASSLARSREEEPELEIRIFELPFRQQLTGLHNDLLDVGFALSNQVNEGLIAEPLWSDPLAVVMPARHPLLAHVQVKLQDALAFPLVLCHPDAGSGCHDQLLAAIDAAQRPLKVVDRVSSLGVMLTLVGAGYGISLAIASQVQELNRSDIVTRPLAGTAPLLSTFLIRRAGQPSEPLRRFLARALNLVERKNA